ncbi:MAG: hypothetical protein ACE5FA_02170 [Dehalococcoidia bacterium]
MTTKVTAQDPRTAIEESYNLLGDQRVTQRSRTFADDFGDGYLDTANKWTNGSTVSGTIAEAGGVLSLNTGATANSKGRIYGQQFHSLVSGSTSIWKARLRCPEDLVANNNRLFGLESSDANDRIYFEFSGTTVYARIDRAGATGDSEATITVSKDWTLFHDFEIQATKSNVRLLLDDVAVANFSSRSTSTPLIAQTRLRPFFTASNGTNNDERGLDVDHIDVDRTPDPWRGGKIKVKTLTADGQVIRGPGLLMWFQALTPSIGSIEIAFHDATGNSAASKIYDSVDTFSDTISGIVYPIGIDRGIEFTKGLYLDMTGASRGTMVGYID